MAIMLEMQHLKTYRLEKIEKITGLDIKNFEDAMTFKIALMVARYNQMLDDEE